MHNTALAPRRLPRQIVLLTASIVLSSCTTQLRLATPTPKQTDPVVGHVYSLPRIDHQLTVEREIVECKYGFKTQTDAVLAWLAEAAQTFAKPPRSNNEQIKAAFARLQNDLAKQPAEVLAAVDVRLGSGWQVNTDAANWDADASSVRFLSLFDAGQFDPAVQVKVELRASAAPLISADNAHIYAIDYTQTHAPTKVTDFTFENYANGTLKSVNVTIDDQTGAVIQSVLSGAAKIAAATGGFPLPVNAHGNYTTSGYPSFKEWKKGRDTALAGLNPCATPVQLKLAQRKALADIVESGAKTNLEKMAESDQAAADLVKLTAERDKQKAAVADLDDHAPGKLAAKLALAKLEAAVKASQAEASKAEKAQLDALDALAEAEKKLAAIRKALTKTSLTLLTWEQKSPANWLAGGADDAFESWFDKGRSDTLCSDFADKVPCLKQFEQVMAQLKVTAAVYPRSANFSDMAWNANQPHLVYRQPLQSTLYVCKSSNCIDDAGNLMAIAANRLLESPVAIPQMGLLASLPLVNGPFQNNSIAASFSENGALTKSVYKSNATAAKAAAVFDESADTLLKFKTAKRNQDTEKIKQQKSEVDAQTELLKSQLALEKAKAELDKQRESTSGAAAQ